MDNVMGYKGVMGRERRMEDTVEARWTMSWDIKG